MTDDDHLEVRDSLAKQAALLAEILSAILTAAKERDPATVFIIQSELTARASRIEDRQIYRQPTVLVIENIDYGRVRSGFKM